MAETNPFVFGKVVTRSNFCNRKKEMKQIKQIVLSKNNLILVSPRRFGKTSLVVNSLKKYEIPYVFIDCFNIENEISFIQRLTQSYLETLKKGKVLDKIKHLSKILNIEYSFSIKGFNIKVNKYDQTSLKKLIKEISAKHVIVFDEFQELFVINENLVKQLRSIMQFITQSFIFLGSKKHLMLYLFSNQKSPFYNFAEIMPLDKINDAEWNIFIKRKFKNTKLKITKSDIDEILNTTESIPFYVQYLCYHLWQERQKNKNIKVEKVVNNIINTNSYVYNEIFTKLPNTQKKALLILTEIKEGIFSNDVLEKYNFKSSQSLNKSLKLLEEKGIIERNGDYRFNDPIFKRFLITNQKV